MSRSFAPLAAFVLVGALWSGAASAQSCTGRFVNPISDVCWECLFPISIGPIRMGSAAGAPDTPNPSSPICLCGSPIPRIGLSLGVWEPARLVDVSRKPWCFPNLGGLTLDPGLPAGRGKTGSSGGDGATGSVWHAHYYVYPLLSWIGALLDLGCLEGGSLDIAWTSELDPAWLDDELSFLLNPEAALFANLPAQAACAADCAAASAGLPLDPMFWCAGCQGGMYPLNYAVGDVVAFHRPYKRLGMEKGDEMRVAGVDHKARTVELTGADGRSVAWEPERLAARTGGVEVYRGEEMELRTGDRIRWTRNDAGLGLVNSQTAEVAAVKNGAVTFRLEDGRRLDLSPGDPQTASHRPRLGLDRACVSRAAPWTP